jgi:hypothetical protein
MHMLVGAHAHDHACEHAHAQAYSHAQNEEIELMWEERGTVKILMKMMVYLVSQSMMA